MTRSPYLPGALVCAASAAFIAWQAAIGSDALRVPPPIAFIAAFIFALTAARLLQLRTNPDSAGNAFALLFFVAMATIGGWIAIGAGTRACTGDVGGVATMPTSGLSCRIPFGIGSLITGAFACYLAARLVRARMVRR